MTLYAIYTPAKTELATEAEIADLGIRAECAKRVDMIRQGKRRWPDAVISPYISNYVFAWMQPEQWHVVKRIKAVRGLMAIPSGAERGVEKFLASINADYLARMSQFEAGERIAEYEPGDILTILTGPFAGQLAKFTRMVESENDIFPQIEADMQIMGQTVKMKMDPLAARKLA